MGNGDAMVLKAIMEPPVGWGRWGDCDPDSGYQSLCTFMMGGGPLDLMEH